MATSASPGASRIPFEVIAAGTQETELADGSTIAQRLYLGEVTFGARRRWIEVVFTDSSDSLVGTGMLLDMRLLIDFAKARVALVTAPPHHGRGSSRTRT